MFEENDLFFIDVETSTEKQTLFNKLLYIQIIAWKKTSFRNLLKNCKVSNYIKFIPKTLIIEALVLNQEKKLILINLLNSKKRLVFFNATFDLSHLLKWLYPTKFKPEMDFKNNSKIFIKAFVWDLYLLLKITHPGYKKNSLQDWAHGIHLSKDLQTSFKSGESLTESQINYMKNDVKILVYILAQLQLENYSWTNTFTHRKEKTFTVYIKFFYHLIFFSIDCYFRGLSVDGIVVEDILKKKETEQKKLAELNIINHSINFYDVKSGKSFEKLIVPLLPKDLVANLEKTPTGIFKFGFKEISLLYY